jgi:hypothetical protein
MSVYKYVKKGTLIKDILEKGNIPEMDAPAKIATGENNVFIRWNVEIPDDLESCTWKDPEIQQLWTDYYYKFFSEKKGFCYVSGKVEPIASLH